MSNPVDIEATVALLRALANPARLRVMLRLLDGECAVATLETELSIRQPNLSQHLAELRDAGLVSARRESRAMIYGIAGDRPRHLVATLLYGPGGSQAPFAAARSQRRPLQAACFARVAAA